MTKRSSTENPSANTSKRHHGGGDGDDFIPLGTKKEVHATLHFDGACRGNGTRHAKSSFGFVLVVDKGETVRTCKCIDAPTNNTAEYEALLRGMDRARQMGVTHLRCFGDSMLVVMQMQKKWKVNNPGIRGLWLRALGLARDFTDVSFTHVARESNKEADSLANAALDGSK